MRTIVSEGKLSYKKISKGDRPLIKNSGESASILFDNWDKDEIGLFESFKILLLDRGNKVLSLTTISSGGYSGTVVDAKMVFSAALLSRASAVILCHNHPSGRMVPSVADQQLTEKLHKAGKLLDLPVLDHIILGPEGQHYSFADEGHL